MRYQDQEPRLLVDSILSKVRLFTMTICVDTSTNIVAEPVPKGLEHAVKDAEPQGYVPEFH